MFEKLVEKLTAAGLDAREVETFAGQYFDGSEHGEFFPVVRVEMDFSTPFSRLDDICKRRGLVYDWRSCWGCGVRLVTIWRADDRERALRLDDVARAFLDAFWMYRHENGPEDGAGMIAAGRAAAAALEWRVDNVEL